MAQYVPHVFATRAWLMAKSGTTASCLYECGAKNVDVEWEVEDENAEAASHAMTMTFAIGSGKDTSYKPRADQCLSRCQVLAQSTKEKCKNLHRGMQSVSKEQGYKLCCVPRTCGYDPAQSTYHRHLEGDRLRQGLRPYTPLKPIIDDNMPARTCLCCKKDHTQIAWDRRIKTQCMLAYSKDAFMNSVNGAVRTATLRVSDAVLRARCNSYCSHYPEYPFGKRSRETRFLLAHTIRSLQPPVTSADSEIANIEPAKKD